MMLHPGDRQLASFSGNESSGLERLRVWWHVRDCDRCRREVDAMQANTALLRTSAARLPAGLNWDRLAAEMTANIHVGLEAGECVGSMAKRKPKMIGWRPVAATAGMGLMLATAWWLNPPRQNGSVVKHSPVEIRTSATGLEVKENGSTLILMHTRGQQAPIIVSTPGSLRARYVDQDTGQVTINNVYAD
jgi:hypothetical protein